MAHLGRSPKVVDGSVVTQRQQLHQQQQPHAKGPTGSGRPVMKPFVLVEDLIQLIEAVAHTLESGINNKEQMQMLMANLKQHGFQLEQMCKDTLDRTFVVFRNASQDERLNLMTRLNLLQLIELRAKGWEDNGFNMYYQTKQANSAEMREDPVLLDNTSQSPTAAAFLSTSPTFGGANNMSAAAAAFIGSVGSAQQTQLLLGPGEVIRNSGKFPKPTKIPGKTYFKDEVVIRNADSGKVMGIKGRRVHMIEELSETIISFQRVNPGAKERLVQITGPSEEKINYGKQLIEDTIRRNASPVRLEPTVSNAAGEQPGNGGSCSSLTSSNSDEVVQPRTPVSNLANRLSFNSAQNFMTAQQAAAAQAQQHHILSPKAGAIAPTHLINMAASVPLASGAGTGGGSAAAAIAAGKSLRAQQQVLLHSYSTNDASLGEYKYTVNVGASVIKITGDCCEYVRMAKLVLDDYFSSAEFLASVEAGAALDGNLSTPSTPLGAPPIPYVMGTHLQGAGSSAENTVSLSYPYSIRDGNDDEVFVDTMNTATPNTSGSNTAVGRSRRSYFSRREMEMEEAKAAAPEPAGPRITYEMEHILYFAKSPHSWAFPKSWAEICEKCPNIVRNQDLKDESNRFDGDKYLELTKAALKRNISAVDETNAEGDNQDND